MKKQPVNSRRGCLTLMSIAGITVIVFVVVLAIAVFSPGLAAQGSDILRNLIGDMAVAQLESAVFQIQDVLEQWRYDVGWATPSAPWPTSNPGAVQLPVTSMPIVPTPTTAPNSTELAPALQPIAILSASLPTVAWTPPPV